MNTPTDVDFANFVKLLFGNIVVCVNIKPLTWYFYDNQLWNEDIKECYRSLIDEKIYPIIVRYIDLCLLDRKYCKDEIQIELLKKRYLRLVEISNKHKKTSDRNNICIELKGKCFKTDFCKDMNKAKNQLLLKNGL